MQHHLVAVARRALVQPARQRCLGHQGNGVRLPLRESRLLVAAGRNSVRGPLATVRRRRPPGLVARSVERPPQHRTDLRRQPAAHHHHPVVLDPRPQRTAGVPPLVFGLLRGAVDAAPPADDALHVLGRAGEGDVEQGLFIVGRGHAGDGAHLGVGDPAPAHGVAQLGQLAEGAGHPHVLAGGARREPRAPGQPLRARQAAAPALLLVELADQDQQLVCGGVDAGGEFGDAVAELLESSFGAAGSGRRRTRVRGVRKSAGGRRTCGKGRRNQVVATEHGPL